jgi:hypothetical protein
MAIASKPDFSGEYALNVQSSTLAGGAAAVRNAVLRIQHSEPILRCQAAFAFDGTSFNLGLQPSAARRDDEPPRLKPGRQTAERSTPQTRP